MLSKAGHLEPSGVLLPAQVSFALSGQKRQKTYRACPGGESASASIFLLFLPNLTSYLFSFVSSPPTPILFPPHISSFFLPQLPLRLCSFSLLCRYRFQSLIFCVVCAIVLHKSVTLSPSWSASASHQTPHQTSHFTLRFLLSPFRYVPTQDQSVSWLTSFKEINLTCCTSLNQTSKLQLVSQCCICLLIFLRACFKLAFKIISPHSLSSSLTTPLTLSTRLANMAERTEEQNERLKAMQMVSTTKELPRLHNKELIVMTE